MKLLVNLNIWVHSTCWFLVFWEGFYLSVCADIPHPSRNWKVSFKLFAQNMCKVPCLAIPEICSRKLQDFEKRMHMHVIKIDSQLITSGRGAVSWDITLNVPGVLWPDVMSFAVKFITRDCNKRWFAQPSILFLGRCKFLHMHSVAYYKVIKNENWTTSETGLNDHSLSNLGGCNVSPRLFVVGL